MSNRMAYICAIIGSRLCLSVISKKGYTTMSRKHFYITFGDEIPEEIERAYNKIVRKEEYSL